MKTSQQDFEVKIWNRIQFEESCPKCNDAMTNRHWLFYKKRPIQLLAQTCPLNCGWRLGKPKMPPNVESWKLN